MTEPRHCIAHTEATPYAKLVVLLTGTPHQGDQGKFRNLLTLVRPDLASLISNIDQTPDVVREIILRNRKIDAVDIDGNFLFHGLLVRRVEVEIDEQFTILETRLRQYLSRGYGAGDAIGGKEGRAVGFVMTIYRKLASSSVAALWIALRRRLDRLSQQPAPSDDRSEAFDEEDQPEADDNLDQRGPAQKRQPFFEGEEIMLRDLIARGEACMRTDRKGAALVEIVREVVRDQGEKNSYLHGISSDPSVFAASGRTPPRSAANDNPWRHDSR